MEALPTSNPAAGGWTLERAAGNLGVYVALPPSPRHYLNGMTPGTFGGKFGYGFLRPDVAKAVVERDARVRAGK